MRFATLMILALTATAAQADCVEEAGRRLLSCRRGCSSNLLDGAYRLCESHCNATYYQEKRACQRLGLIPYRQTAFPAIQTFI